MQPQTYISINIMFLLLVPTAATLLLLLLLILNLNSKQKNRPPGPLGLPLIGNLLQFDKSNPHLYLWRLSRTYGPLAYLKHGPTPILVVSSASIAKHILTTHDSAFCSRPPVTGQQRLSYGGLDMAFSAYNPHWKEMRRICLLHLLSPKQLLSFRPVREDEVSRMVSKINSSGKLGVNLSGVAMSLASNLICRVAFGRRYEDDEFDKKRMDRLVMEAQSLMASFYFSDHFPAPFSWVLDKLSGLLDRLDRNCRDLDVFYQQLIDEHQSAPKTSDDIIHLMIQLKAQNQDLNWDHIKALLMNLFVAGTDTVAAAIVWTMTALMLWPTIMKKAQTEIRQVIGSKGRVDEDDINKLPYLKGVVLEALRMYPPAPLLHRVQILGQDCTLEGYKIRPGTRVIINGWAIGRDPETWDSPDEFRPERFDGDDVKIGDEIFPFGGGRRGCPGMRLGLASIELALANLLYSFDWALAQGEHLDTHSLPGLTMHKKTPLVLIPSHYHFHVQN